MTSPALTVQSSIRRVHPFRRPTVADLALVGGGIAVAIALIVLLGWALDAAVLKSLVPGTLTMKANTAVSFLLMGVGVALLDRAEPGARLRTIGLLLVGAAMVVALATWYQYLTGVDLGIDQLLVREPAGELGTATPGRMSPLTAISFTMLGLAVLAARRMPRYTVALSGFTFVVAVLKVSNFVFGAAVPVFLAGRTDMAISTAVGMGFLALGVMGLLGRSNPFVALAGRSPTARLLRRMLVVLIAVPILMAWLRLEGQSLGLYESKYGTSLMLVGTLTLSVVAVLVGARWAGDLDSRREAMEVERDQFFELSVDMLAVVGADGRFRRVNGAWDSALGYPARELIGRPMLEFVHPSDAERTISETASHFEEGRQVSDFQHRFRHRDGTYRWLEWMSRSAPDGSVSFAVARDVTDRKHREDRRARRQQVLESRNQALVERTVRDPLTGLHNRRHFDAQVERLERRWARVPADRRPVVSVIIFDLDHFGQVNNLYGHQAGDVVLRRFASLLTNRFRDQDLVARYGGEEFVAVVEGTTSAQAVEIAQDVRVALEDEPLQIGSGSSIRVTVSAGCAQLGADGSVSAALAMADVWLAQAKRAGRNQVIGL